jgi:predicted ArsR family transcriptional regulator
LDWVNVEGASKYWEKLEFNADRTQLTLTGRVVEGCACAFADCEQPPLALCQHCCKSLQQALFSTLLGQPVEVEITAAFLLGDQRCNTIIHLG